MRLLQARRNGRAQLFAWHPLFARMSVVERARVAALVDHVRVPAGTVLVRQGARPVEPFVIERGWARVELDGVPVATVDRRQTVGLSAWAGRARFGATVIAGSPMELYLVQPRSVRTFLELVPWAVAPDWSDFAPAAVERPRQPLGR